MHNIWVIDNKGHPKNKLQNSFILLIFRIWKIRDICLYEIYSQEWKLWVLLQ